MRAYDRITYTASATDARAASLRSFLATDAPAGDPADAFVDRMADLLGDELDGFLAALSAPRVRGSG